MNDHLNFCIISFLVFFCIIFTVSDVYAYENLYVSHDVVMKNIGEKYLSPSSNVVIDGCTNFVPEHYHSVKAYRYFDQFSPTFDVGFLKNEYPLTVNSIPFEKSDFVTKSKTLQLETGDPISITLLLFEDRGPQNIQNVTMYFEPQNSSIMKNSSSSFSIVKDEPKPVSDSIQYYIRGGIDEDFDQSYLYGNTWTNYSLQVNDTNNLFQNVTAGVSKENHKLKITLELIPKNILPKSSLIITTFDIKGNGMICKILDIWESSSDADHGPKSTTTLMHETLFVKKLEKTNLALFDFKTSRFDGGQPIVFSGKLTTEDGTRISNSAILIKSDHSCTLDGIIAKGMTDKYGKFWIYTMPKKWNHETNLIKVHAEFLGDDKFLPSKSQEQVRVIFSYHAEEC